MTEPLDIGKYRLVRRIATGGMAEILLASIRGEAGFERPIIIKRILPQYANEREFARRLIDEGLIAGKLTHANIVQVFDLGKLGPDYFIAMELVDGPDLRSVLQKAAQRHFQVPVPIAAHILWNVARALAYAHEKKDENFRSLNIIHRDVSPANVMLSWEGEIKLTDFGIAKATQSQTTTLTGVLQGKFPYMSPEQADGAELDQRSDVFSFGSVAYEMLSLKRPFQAESDARTLDRVRMAKAPPVSVLRPDLPADLVEVVSTCLQKDPANRFAGGAALEHSLAAVLQKEGWIVGEADVADFLDTLYGPDKVSWLSTQDPPAGDLPSEALSPSPLTPRDLAPGTQRTPRVRPEEPRPGQFTRSVVVPAKTATRRKQKVFWTAWTAVMAVAATLMIADYLSFHVFLGAGGASPAEAPAEIAPDADPALPGASLNHGPLVSGESSDAGTHTRPAPGPGKHPTDSPFPGMNYTGAATDAASANAASGAAGKEVVAGVETGTGTAGTAAKEGAAGVETGTGPAGTAAKEGAAGAETGTGPAGAEAKSDPQKPKRSVTTLRVEPAGAIVFVGSRKLGESPVSFATEPGAQSEVRVEKKGYATLSFTLEYPAPLELYKKMTPEAAGVLKLRYYPASAEVLIDGVPQPTSPAMNILEVTLPEGDHELTVRSADQVTTKVVAIRRDKEWTGTITAGR